MEAPQLILLFSGKRKSGKDYLTEILAKNLTDDVCEIVRISEPIKRAWADRNELNLQELLSDGAYKENYRKEMILWSDEQRKLDYGIFCREAMSRRVGKPICIVSDIRRKNDIRYFREQFGDRLLLIRIQCEDCVRAQRGWEFQAGVDDIESECGLDDFSEWDIQIVNSGTVAADDLLKTVMERVQQVTQ